MAIPVAVLSVLVTANTGGAAASLTRLDRRLKTTATTGEQMGARVATGAKYAALGLAAAAAGSVYAAAKFESAFANVRKTVDANEKGFARIREGLLDLSTQVPVSANALAELAGEAGALGVKSRDIVQFTKTASMLGTTTNIAAGDAANALARLTNIMDSQGRKAFERMGSTLVDLGNKGASTEDEIADMALRIAGAGKTLGLTEAQVLGLSSALANVGIRSEMGGSAISRVMLTMQDAIAQGGAEMEAFAEIAGLTTDQFVAQFERSAPAAIAKFAAGLGEINKAGGSTIETLEGVNLNEVRVRDTLLRIAGNTKNFTETQKVANAAWGENNALAREAAERYDTLESQLRMLGNAVVRTGVDVGTQLLPDIKELVAIMRDPDISLDEKIARVGDKLGDMIAEWGPKAAEAGGKVGLQIVSGLGRAFLDANLWGKLFLGGLFIRAVGGKGALLAVGKKMAVWIAAPMMATIAAETAAGAAGGSMAAKFAGLGKTLGRLTGVGMAVAIIAAVADKDVRAKITQIVTGEPLDAAGTEELAQRLGDSGFGKTVIPEENKVLFRTELGNLLFNAETQKVIDAQGGKLKRLIGKNVDEVETAFSVGVGSVPSVWEQGFTDAMTGLNKKLGSSVVNVDRDLGKFRDAFGLTERKTGDDLKKVANSADDYMSRTRRAMDRESGRGADAVSGNVRRMVDAVGKGLQTLGSNTNRALQAFGAKKMVGFSIAGVGDTISGALKRQRGGMIPGHGPGDKVGVMAEPGEGFINKTAVDAWGGPAFIDFINKSAPRFQAGGMVTPAGQSGVVVNAAIAKEVSSWLNRYKMTLTQGFNPGGPSVSPGHLVTGTALDTVPSGGWSPGPTGIFEAGLRAALSAGKKVLYGSHGVGTPWPNHGFGNHAHTEWGMSGGVGGAAAEMLKRIVLGGPDGPLKLMGQGSLDMARKAANAYLAKQTAVLPVGAHPDTGGPIADIARAMVTNRWNAGQWPPFLTLKGRESGPNWDPTITNPSSGAGGIPQALPPSKMGSPAWPPTQGRETIMAQLNWMMGYIADRYGNPASALGFHDANNYYAGGGVAKGWSVVGEQGPELVQFPPSGARVHSNSDSQRMLSSPVVNVTIHARGSVEFDQVQAEIDGAMADVGEVVFREGGRGRGRGRQVPGRAGRV